MSNTVTGYQVRFTVVVDRPERRGPSYAPVPAGHRIPTTFTFPTQGAAVRYWESILAGGEDYASEYVSKAQVVRTYAGRSPAFVRKEVQRARARYVDPTDCGCGFECAQKRALKEAA